MTSLKIMAVILRVDVWADRDERRDAIDQKIYEVVTQLGYTPVLIPNNLDIAKELVSKINFEAVLLSGGNSLAEYGGDAPERDAVEAYFVEWARHKAIPIIGICRGMQTIAVNSGVKLISTPHHIGKPHQVMGAVGTFQVNSFHGWSVSECPKGFDVIALTEDNLIEGFVSYTHKTIGLMWHPERNKDLVSWKRDINILREFLRAVS